MKGDFSIRNILKLRDDSKDDMGDPKEHCLGSTNRSASLTVEKIDDSSNVSGPDTDNEAERHGFCGDETQLSSLATPLLQASSGDERACKSKAKKTRTVFSRRQVNRLEKAFEKKCYFSNVERASMAKELDLSETQVKIWLQNRRNKFKKQICLTAENSKKPCVPILEYKDSEHQRRLTWYGPSIRPVVFPNALDLDQANTAPMLDLDQINRLRMRDSWLASVYPMTPLSRLCAHGQTWHRMASRPCFT